MSFGTRWVSCHHDRVAPARSHPRIAGCSPRELTGGIGIHFHERSRAELIVVADLSGAGTGVEMLHHPTGITARMGIGHPDVRYCR